MNLILFIISKIDQGEYPTSSVLVERPTFNRMALGSSPKSGIHYFDNFFFEQTEDN